MQLSQNDMEFPRGLAMVLALPLKRTSCDYSYSFWVHYCSRISTANQVRFRNPLPSRAREGDFLIPSSYPETVWWQAHNIIEAAQVQIARPVFLSILTNHKCHYSRNATCSMADMNMDMAVPVGERKAARMWGHAHLVTAVLCAPDNNEPIAQHNSRDTTNGGPSPLIIHNRDT